MAIQAKVATPFGDKRELYIRLNNFEQLANHGVPAIARFRGYISRRAFEEGGAFVSETFVEFTPDIEQPLWPQAYAALKALDAAAPIAEQLAQLDAEIGQDEAELEAAEAAVKSSPEGEAPRFELVRRSAQQRLARVEKSLAERRAARDELVAKLQAATKARDALSGAKDL